MSTRPSHRTPGALLHPEQPVQPRPERVGVDEQGRGAQRVPLGERAGERRRPRPARAAHHADGAPRRGPLAHVGQRLRPATKPRPAGRPPTPPQRHRGPEDGRRPATGRPRGRRADAAGRAPRPGRRGRRRPAPGRRALQVARQRAGSAHDLHLDAGRRAERDDGVVDGSGPGEEEDGHDDEPRAGPPTPASAAYGACGQGVPEVACGRLTARPAGVLPPTMTA